MTTVAPISMFGLFRSTSAVLFALTLLWIVISILLFKEIVASQWLAALILLVAGITGPLLYFRFYRLRLQYDDDGFALFTGKNKVAAGQWKHFNRVALFHRGYAMFAVRLYTPEKTYVDIPVSELQLDPNTFRSFVTQMINQNVTSDK